MKYRVLSSEKMMTKFFTPRGLFAALAVLTMAAATAQAPDPVALLQHIRHSAVLSDADLQGEIRKRGVGKIPLTLFKEGENIQFLFQGGSLKGKRFHVRLDDDPDLFEITRENKTVIFPVKRLSERIGGTDFTYEDLALRFLYWNRAQIVGEEIVNGHDCWKLRVDNPSRKGSYGTVHVWVHKKYLALIRTVAFDFQGKPVRKFEITDVMKVGEHYTVKKMRIDTLSPATGRSTGASFLSFDKPKKLRMRNRVR